MRILKRRLEERYGLVSIVRNIRKNESMVEWDFDKVVKGYLKVASLFPGKVSPAAADELGIDVDDSYLISLSDYDFTDLAIKEAKEDVREFLDLLEEQGILEEDLKVSPFQAGIDFWLDRSGNKSGARDRPELYVNKKIANAVAKTSASFGRLYVVLNDYLELDFE